MLEKVSGTPDTVVPSVTTSASPPAATDVPSVVTNDGTRTNAVTAPFTTPTATPTPTPISIPMTTLSVVCVIPVAATTPLSAAVDPIDRSSSPAMMAKVTPAAAIARPALPRKICWMLRTDRKVSDRDAK